MAYRIVYDPEALRDADFYGNVSRIRRACEAKLRHEPLKETRNRFEAAPNPFGRWELREQPYRIYYDVDEEQGRVVVLAVLYKPREMAYRRGKGVSTRE